MGDPKTEVAEERSFRNRHSFLLFITLSITVACVIVTISMAMYNSSGAAQLDLSRPGFQSVRSQVGKDDAGFQTFSAYGTMSRDVISDFKVIYDKQAKKIKVVDAFGGDPLSPDALGISSTPTTQ